MCLFLKQHKKQCVLDIVSKFSSIANWLSESFQKVIMFHKMFDLILYVVNGIWQWWRNKHKKNAKKNTKNRANNNNGKHTRNMRYLWIPPFQNKYLIINILNNTLITHLTSFKNNLSKQTLNLWCQTLSNALIHVEWTLLAKTLINS